MQTQDPPIEKLKLAVNLLNQKKFRQSLSLSKEMKESHPNSIILYNIIGASYSGLKQFKNALVYYQKSLEINPNYSEAAYNMGIAYKNIGEYDLAIYAYKKALKINPKYCEANFNLGNALKTLDKIEQAIEQYRQAISVNPKFYEAHYNLGNALLDQGDHIKAIECYIQSIKIKPNSTEAFKRLSNIFTKVVFKGPNPELEELIISIFNLKTIVKPIALSRASISLLKFDPFIQKLLDKPSSIETDKSIESLTFNLSKNKLLLKLMSISLIPDSELEAALRNIRYSLIKSIHKIKNTPELLLFQSALALHCFTNEYIYNLSKEEISLIKSLENEINANFAKGVQLNKSLILCLASYKALNQYDWSEFLENVTQISDVVSRQILEPIHENQIKSELPILQVISNQISSKVRGQYEDNPYPRWVNTGLSQKNTIYSEIKSNEDLRVSDTRIYDVDKPHILIAGCGTGQHSIRVASKFKEAKILAIDLSLSSLAYAKRKTIELGIENIDYMQADILDLEKLNRKFDMIQSSGVLHHMENPMAGWHTLKNCLKTGGLMKIGLYSNLARNHIVKIRKEVKQSGIDLDDESIRSYRDNLINSKEEHHIKIKLSNNFYSLSEIRDLLFHVQEHRFTIPKIKKCLNELNLNFCGFDSAVITKDFLKHHSEKLDLYNLDKWSIFEEKKPDTFIAMYQFWCQKN